MKDSSLVRLPLLLLALSCSAPAPAAGPAVDPLPSWNDGPAKQAIPGFVGRVTREGSPEYVAPAERIATFDNDGTLWSEQPVYFQLMFTFDQIKAMAPGHPEWQGKEPFASFLKGDMKGVLASDRASSIGKLDKAWDEAVAKGWTVVDMQKDWKVIYPFEKK